ncbi:MAG: ribosome maturation factor RimP [Gordonibacter sp.]|nr:ribosome maturation factor RimP [Gordonibacter sp.]
MLGKKEQQLLDALSPRAAAEGIEVVTVEVVGAKKAPTIRVYIDTPDGVSFDELSSAQAWINAVMDELDPFPGAYTLEVSSPGIDRPLRTPRHFAQFVGGTAVVKTSAPLEGRSAFTGVIVAVGEEMLELDVDGRAVCIPFSTIKHAHLKGVVDFNS